MNKFWCFTRNETTGNSNETIELRIDGDIVDDDMRWLYDWLGIPTSSPNTFREELKEYDGKNITVWIDSYGGSVFAAAGIYNALKEHNGKITVKIDGKAISAASVVAMAGDEILMSPVGIMMIHNPLTYAEGDMRELRKAAEVLDEVKETIINAYAIKTNKSREEISTMMDDETWMSANVAVKEGFADGILYTDEQLEVSNIKDFAYNKFAIVNSTNKAVKKLFEIEKELKDKKEFSVTNNKKEGNGSMKIKTVEELKNSYPELVSQIENNARAEGAKQERNRIKAIDEIAQTIDTAIVVKAKYEDPMNAEKLAFKALKSDSLKGEQYLNNLKKDKKDSKVNSIGIDIEGNLTEEEKEKQERLNTAENIANMANKRRKK